MRTKNQGPTQWLDVAGEEALGQTRGRVVRTFEIYL